jgi:hypothetical protein
MHGLGLEHDTHHIAVVCGSVVGEPALLGAHGFVDQLLGELEVARASVPSPTTAADDGAAPAVFMGAAAPHPLCRSPRAAPRLHMDLKGGRRGGLGRRRVRVGWVVRMRLWLGRLFLGFHEAGGMLDQFEVGPAWAL